jgi:hypothetical protein
MYFDGHVDLGAYGYIMHSNWDKHEVLVIDDSIFQDVQKLALAKEQFNISIDSGHHEPLTLMALLVLPDCQAVGHGSFFGLHFKHLYLDVMCIPLRIRGL